MGMVSGGLQDWIKTVEGSSEIAFDDDGNRAIYEFSPSGEKEPYEACFEVDEKQNLLSLFVSPSNKVPLQKLSKLSELLSLINHDLPLGFFDVDFETGSYRFRYGVDVENGRLSTEMIQNMVDLCVSMLDTYSPAIFALAYSEASPIYALAQLGEEDKSNPLQPWLFDKSNKQSKTWGAFYKSSHVQSWATTLKHAIESKANADLWRIIGTSVIFESGSRPRCTEILQRVAEDAKMSLLVIPGADVPNIPLYSDPYKALSPLLVYLQPWEWKRPYTDEESSSDQAKEILGFQKNLTKLLAEFDPQNPVVFVTSSSNPDDAIHPQLKKVGGFDRIFEVQPPTLQESGAHFVSLLGVDNCGHTITRKLGKVGKLLSINFDDTDELELVALHLKRMAYQRKQKIEFNDLVEVTLRGITETSSAGETSSQMDKLQTAYHEAGHAITAVICSKGKDIPEFATIVPGKTFDGVVKESSSYYYYLNQHGFSYERFLTKIRICLAGRAAEDLIMGPGKVDSGAQSDFEHATHLAFKAFTRYGFSPDMLDGGSGDNLRVFEDGLSPSSLADVEKMVRKFLRREYEATKQLLAEHRNLLDTVAEHLIKEPMVDQEELAGLCAGHVDISNHHDKVRSSDAWQVNVKAE